MSVRAKFVVESVNHYPGEGPTGADVTMSAAVTGEENKEWAKYTPCGQLAMTIDNPEAAAQFTVGQYVYITFEPVNAPAKV